MSIYDTGMFASSAHTSTLEQLPPLPEGTDYRCVLNNGEPVGYKHERSMLLAALAVRKKTCAGSVVSDFMRIAEIAAQQGSDDLALRIVEKALLASGNPNDNHGSEILFMACDVTVYGTLLNGKRFRIVIFHRPNDQGDIMAINGSVRPDPSRDSAVMHESKGWEIRRQLLLDRLGQLVGPLKPLYSLCIT